ncbi:MAG: DUF763 domain-containing protein [Gemmatimonadetes bacterium]|uniref:DUF763 domain-containing protein n=1 Tax=Candidatus Kutchimonas denitrificans TaxID=3056748 RepID=A0AAE4Z9Y4_9BACT|nr:DUF763 domain-containing protein [Gemmatimonadota bacterium]NIR76494.1 DUF763 domain-containing protein [Candidatus Kutchimonas denitrificans]NIS03312.1 DUF763 domain-containing protein [Gemmatimonadota bacterium]NIT69173.1 DUF763 domain-containing protein [Gemmatimonadota bacterium]NIU54565.1 DUF763 domain-containing protein [Gemmatimonadota bacterium]
MARRTGSATLPLHSGRAPRWLFERMTRLARAFTEALVIEYGAVEFLRRLSDPYWFQAFGCVLGFDWHSSGVTTTVCGALKAGLAGAEADTSVYVAGGKGKASRKTPDELRSHAGLLGLDGEALVYASRMSAKVDSAAVQDGFQVYHHSFFLTPSGEWAVVQQGMRERSRSARRYHWLGERVDDFVCEPHSAVCSDLRDQLVLNLVARESEGARSAAAEIARADPARVENEVRKIVALEMPERHHVDIRRDVNPRNLSKVLLSTYEAQPRDFEALLALRGVGARSIRALSLIAELAYGAPASYRDPARFSFAHGGKDGHPYPVDRESYDRSVEWLRGAVRRARVGRTDRLRALRQLAAWEAR